MKIRFLVLICSLLGCECLSAQCVNIGNKRILFLDYDIIERLDGAELKMHSPIDRGVAFYFDKSWEGSSCAYVTIIKDSTFYRAYYRGRLTSKTNGAKQITCVAESKDGVHWYKPQLSIYRIAGYDENNIVLMNEGDVSHNFSPFIDINPKHDLRYRYKGIGGKEGKGLFVYQSIDGLKWEKMKEEPFYTDGNFDSQNVVFWSPEHNSYLLFFRKWRKVDKVLYRTIAMSRSEDFEKWEKYKLLDFGDTPIENLYTNQIGFYYRAPQFLIGIGARFFQNKKVIPDSLSTRMNAAYVNDCSDVYLMSSKDALHFDRIFMESFIRPGIGYNNWTSRTNYPALNVVETSDSELSVYVNENYMQSDAHLRRYSIRIDGFTSICAGYVGGVVITKPIKFSGTRLEINYSTSAAGEIRIELLDERDEVIPGYSKEDCDCIVGDEISRGVTWHGKSDLSSVEGQIVKMKFYLKDADVFSFRYYR